MATHESLVNPSNSVRLDDLLSLEPPPPRPPSIRMLTRHLLTCRRLAEVGPCEQTALVGRRGGVDAVRREILVREIVGDGVEP